MDSQEQKKPKAVPAQAEGIRSTSDFMPCGCTTAAAKPTPLCNVPHQVQKQQMEQQLKDMAAQVGQLQLENRKIAGRNSTLETLLSFRGKEIADLQARNNVRPVCSPAQCMLMRDLAEGAADLKGSIA